MSDSHTPSGSFHAHTPSQGGFFSHEWPYIAMLALSIIGAAIASVAQGAMTFYWMILVPLFGALCVYTRLRDAQRQAALGRLIRIEVLHWGGVFLMMQVIFVPDVARIMNADGSGLAVMILLALGAFTAGAQIGSWRICIIGIVLALGVPLVAWLERWALLITLAGLAVAAIAIFIILHYRAGATAAAKA
ncbi:MAG TPA: hypothetical protein VK446_13745 [Methylocystis sp.]|nr:hypothetical protein [Methylocystis sp.]